MEGPRFFRWIGTVGNNKNKGQFSPFQVPDWAAKFSEADEQLRYSFCHTV